MVRALVLLALCLLLNGCFYVPLDLGGLGQVYEATVSAGQEDQKLLMVRIDGEITDSEDSGLLSSTPAMTSRVRAQLDLARRDEDIKGVLLRINSPGGGVTASDVIHHELARFRKETKKPVVAFFLDTAASGGYYVAQATDRIVSSPTTITGSIGVIAYFPNFKKLGDKIGVEVAVIKSGARKDVGSPFRAMRKDERELMEGLIRQMHTRFVDVVAAGRERVGLKRAAVAKAATGQVYTAKEALALKLVDEIGYMEDAVKVLAKLAKLDKPRVITYEVKWLGSTGATVYSKAQAGRLQPGQGGPPSALDLARRVLPQGPGAVLQYMWVPGAR